MPSVDVTVYTARTPIAMVLTMSSTLNGILPRSRVAVQQPADRLQIRRAAVVRVVTGDSGGFDPS